MHECNQFFFSAAKSNPGMEINIYGNSIYALVGPGLMCSNFTVSFLYKSGKYSLLSFYTINALVGPDFEILIRNFYK